MFAIDYNISTHASTLRERIEGVSRGRIGLRVPSILSMDSIQKVMAVKYNDPFTFSDGTREYNHCFPNREFISIIFQRDWRKRGYLHTPYHMFVTKHKNNSCEMRRYCVRSIGQLRTALKDWDI